MRIYIAILTFWAGENEVFIFQFIYFFYQGCEGIFHCLLELVYLRMFWPAGFDWPSGYKIFTILILIRSLLGIVSEMGCWVTCLAVVVALLVFPELLVVVFIFLVHVALLRKCHSFWCGLAHHWNIGLLVQEMEVNLTFLEHAVISWCEVVLNIGPHFIVLFVALTNEDVW